MKMQELAKKQRRIARLARKCGVLGFVSTDLVQNWDLTKLTELPEDELNNFEECLRDFEALLESLRSLN